jgi:hypothetical protein
MKTSKYLGLAALLCSSATMAGTVEVRPTDSATPTTIPGTCVVVNLRCELTTLSNTFSVIVVGLDQPATAGATLGLAMSPGVTWTASALSTVPPTSGQAFNALVSTPDPNVTDVTSCTGFDCINTALAPTSGTLPSGTVVAFVLTFSVGGPGEYLIDIMDDGGDFSWTDTSAMPIPNTYTQARIINAIPLPAASWLLAPAILAAARFSRRRRAA